MDLITVAQAFHWFDKDRFRTECHRSLSSSYAPGEDCETYDAYVLAITELFSKYEKADRIHIPNVTICVVGEV